MSNPLETRKNSGDYVKDIQNMMHGLGDYAPLQDSAILIESVVIQQLAAVLFQASEHADRKGLKSINAENILFLFRKDKVKLHRLNKYMGIKDVGNGLNNAMRCNDTTGDIMDEPTAEPKENRMKRKKMCQEFIESIDETGDLMLAITGGADPVKTERAIRINNMSMKLDTASYFQFTAARGVSFRMDRHPARFEEWIKAKAASSYNGFKISNPSYELLGYITLETVAQIVDLTFLVRQDATAKRADPFTRVTPLCHSISKDKTNAKLVGNEPPLTPAEIQEALRRYWSPQLCPAGIFNRNTASYLHTRLLAC